SPATLDGDEVAAARRALATFIAQHPEAGADGTSLAGPCRLATPGATATSLGVDPIDPPTWTTTIGNDAILRSSSGSPIRVASCRIASPAVELFAFDALDASFATVAARFDVGNVMPTRPRDLGGQAAGRCVPPNDGAADPTRCTVVWM